MEKQSVIQNKLLHIFDWLRFPLMVGVIFIHSYGFISVTEEMKDSFWGMIIEIFSQGIGRLSVPLFFFISGYLFFYKIDQFSKEIFINKLKRRFKSLFLPYIIWNALCISLYMGLDYLGYHINYLEDKGNNPLTFLRAFIGFDENSLYAYPAVYQLWFLRDLMIIILLSPILYFLLNRFKGVFIGIVGLLWVTGFEIPVMSKYGFSMVSIFFFSSGAYCSTNNFSVLDIFGKVKYIGYLYPCFLILDLFTESIIIHNIGIISGIILAISLCSYFYDKKKLTPVPFLTSATFFLYAIHEPFLLSKIRLDIINHLPVHIPAIAVLGYFASVLLTILISLFLFKLLQKTFPNFTKLIAGNR